MQLESKDFYKLVAVENGVSPDLIKSVGDMIFKELSDLQRNPPNLILDIRGMGYRYLRLKKMREKLNGTETAMQVALGNTRSTPESMDQMQSNLQILRRVSSWYEEFLKEKARIKNLRNAYTTRSQAIIPKGQVPGTSQDQPGEHQGIPTGESKSDRVEDQLPETSPSYRRASLVEATTDKGEVS